ncbi:tail fiber protein [Pseudomonas phage LUZ100]|uniref:Tail fiber protein n=1 Tax=Pseudomonas phage LUZ100 TaxID=2973522 RepID=A0A9Y1DI53_9CAUD|nr:tail fiber protein [Pseudomonas phage LUZ100]
MALARVTYTQSVNGNRNFSVPFPYLSKDHVKVTVNGAAVTFSWLSASSIQLTTAPAIGAKVEVRRVTERNSLLVDFADGSTLTESQLDLASKQNFYLSQEADDLAVESNGLANNAVSIANGATTTANEAKTLANSAVSTANTANSTANQAKTSADSAVVTAGNAANTASSAVVTANGAVQTAQQADSKAGSAVTTASQANSRAASAESKADSAVATANGANTKADAATNTANTALSTANTALSNSEAAVSLANAASISSDEAQASSSAAQAAAQAAAQDAQTAVNTALGLESTVNQVLQDVQAIAGGDLSDFAKNSENLSGLTNKAAARSNLGLGQVDNTRDLDKPISNATQQALDTKAESVHVHTKSQITDFTVSWDEVTGKPSTFTPSSHSHAATDLPGSVRGLVASYGSGWGDPNSSVDHILLSNHANTPNSSFYWHIYTSFYSSISSTANRSQLAIQYNGGNQVYARSCFNSTWTPWVRLDVGDWDTLLNKPSSFTPSAHSHVWADITNPPAQATRWPTWTEVTSKPTTFPPSSHTHGVNDIATAFTAAGLQSLGTDGYQQFPGGLILQWGRTASIAGDSSTTITFPITFPSVVAVAHATPLVTGNAVTSDNWGMVEPISTSQLRVYRGLKGVSQKNLVYWTAIGY